MCSVQKPAPNIVQMPAFGHRAQLNAMKCDNILTIKGPFDILHRCHTRPWTEKYARYSFQAERYGNCVRYLFSSKCIKCIPPSCSTVRPALWDRHHICWVLEYIYLTFSEVSIWRGGPSPPPLPLRGQSKQSAPAFRASQRT